MTVYNASNEFNTPLEVRSVTDYKTHKSARQLLTWELRKALLVNTGSHWLLLAVETTWKPLLAYVRCQSKGQTSATFFIWTFSANLYAKWIFLHTVRRELWTCAIMHQQPVGIFRCNNVIKLVLDHLDLWECMTTLWGPRIMIRHNRWVITVVVWQTRLLNLSWWL